MKNIKAVFFDFDGTIADTLSFNFDKLYRLINDENISVTEKEYYSKIKTNSFFDLIKEWNISWLKLPFFLTKVRHMQEELYGQIEKVKIFPGMEKLFVDLQGSKYFLGIVSSNLQKNVDKFLRLNKLNYFDDVYCESNIFGKDKMISDTLHRNRLKPDDIIYVGDEIRDIEACHKIGVKIIGVPWGLHNLKTLQKNGTDYIAKTPQEIFKLLNATGK